MFVSSVQLYERNPVGGTYRGLISFSDLPVRGEWDYCCSPWPNWFTEEIAAAISKQLCRGAWHGVVSHRGQHFAWLKRDKPLTRDQRVEAFHDRLLPLN
jgi:hypothetical protein